MLQDNLELIVQYPKNGGYICRGFKGLRLANSACVVFDGATVSDQNLANILGEAFSREALRYAGTMEASTMPCSGPRSAVLCHAMDEPTCRKILVRPAASGTPASPGTWPTPSAEAEWLRHLPEPMWEVLPVLPAGASVPAHVPAAWRGINVCFWTRHPVEALWAVIQRAGLAPEESRLFISYVRRDSSAVADQLFESLTEAGFDVFLDRCSVPVGVQFQERLMQDLCDKAMVVLLNSAGVKNSYWVGQEIATIKDYRLGLLELRFPDGEERPDVDPDFTQVIAPADLVPAGGSYAPSAQKLSAALLPAVVNRIKDVHGRALHRRRYQLIDNFAAALANAGRTAQVLPDGTFIVSASGSGAHAVVGLTVRPPELGDFCSLHQRGSVSAGRPGWLISPSPFFLASRQGHVCWLGGISNIQHANEAQMATLAASL